MAECVLVEAERAHGRGGVAAADHGEARGVDEGLGDRFGALGVVGVLEDAHGTVPEDGAGVGELRCVQLAGLGTDVQTLLVGRDGVRGDGGGVGRGLRLQVRELGRDQDVDGQHQLDAVLLGALDVLLDRRDLVLLEQRDADLVPLGLEEGVRHASADEQPVGLAEQLVDDGELVGDLGAAERDHVRALHLVGELLEHADLGGDEVSGIVREPLRQVEDGRVLPVHRAEAVADVDVREAGQLVGEGGALGVVLAGLAGVEAQVLDDGDTTVGEAGNDGLGGAADRVLGEGDVGAEQLTEAGGGRGEGEGGVRGALGAAQVRGDDHAGARVGQRLDGGHYRADAAVVGDGGAVQRDVQVGADEDALARDAFGEQFVDRLQEGSWVLGSLVILRGLVAADATQGPGSATLRCPSPATASRCLAEVDQSWLPTKTVRSTRRFE